MNALSKKVSKSALIVALMATGLFIGEAANAKAKFYINLCFIAPSVAPTMSGSPSVKIANNGGGATFGSSTPVWCSGNNRMTGLAALDSDSGDYASWPIGGSENMKISVTTPTLTYQWAGTGNKTNKVSGKCTITNQVIKMVVGSFDPSNNPATSSYRQFSPAVGNTGAVPGNGLIKVKVDWKPQLGTQPTCTFDASGL